MTNGPSIASQTASTIIVDGMNGYDSTGRRNGPAFKTLSAAKAASIPGDTILVRAGTYVDSNLLKDQVNWEFQPGAIVQSLDQDAGPCRGIFDDRDGFVRCSISGYGSFYTILSNVNTANSKGCMVITNAATDITIQCLEIKASHSSAIGLQGAVCVLNCLRCFISADFIGDPNFNDGNFVASNGIYWENGQMEVICKKILGEKYPVWCNDNSGSNPSTDFYLTADFIMGGAGSSIYFSGNAGNPNFRAWITAKLIQSRSFVPVSVFTGGKCYLIAEKLQADGNVALNVAGAAKAWITVQKISATSNFVLTDSAFTGELYLTCMQYDDVNSTVTTAFALDGTGIVYLNGGYCKVSNGRGLDQISTGACQVRARLIVIDTSNTNSANNVPIRVAGTNLIVDRCTLICGALAKSILATAAGKTVVGYGSHANQAVDAVNLTVQVSAVTVDANVR